MMESPGNHVDTVLQSAQAYGRATVELLKLKSVQKISRNGSALAVRIVLLVLSGVSILFLSIALALWLGTLLESTTLGFLIVGGGYALLCLLMATVLKPWLRRIVSDSMIEELLQ